MPSRLAKPSHRLGLQSSALITALFILTLPYQSAPGADEATAAKEFDALIARYQAANERAWAEIGNSTDTAKRSQLDQEQHPANFMVGEFLKFEEANRGTQLGLSALHHLVSVAGGNGFRSEFSASEGGRQAIKILAAHYLDHPDLDVLFDSMGNGGDDARSLLRQAMSASHRHVRAAAALNLAEILKAEALAPPRLDGILELLANAPDKTKYADLFDLFSKARQRWTGDPAASREESLRLLDQIQSQYADVLEPPRTGYGPIVLKIERSANDALTGKRRRTLGERAESMRFELIHLAIGQPAPPIAGPDAFGNDLKLSDHRGNVTVVMFSFKGCGPCEAMYPGNRKLVETYRGRPFALLGVMGDDDLATVKESVASGTITWPVWWDGGKPGPISSRWNVVGWPDIYVLDQKGIIRYCGTETSELLALAVARLMNEVEPPR